MGEPFLGEIRMFGGRFAPLGWAFCEGQLLPISENDALFALLGTIYGGDGQETFGLPNLGERCPVHVGTGPGLSPRTLGETGGVQTVTLTAGQIGGHNHALFATTNPGTSPNPANDALAQAPGIRLYVEDVPTNPMAQNVLQPQGGSQPHENRHPFLAVSFIISLFGIFPPRN